MPLANPTFTDPGSPPGEAASWTLTAFTSLQALAGFGASPVQAWEDFERWSTGFQALGDVTTVLAFFGAAIGAAPADGFDDFERGWSNAVFLTDMPPAQLVGYPFVDAGVEDFEAGWSNVPFALSWTDVHYVSAGFVPDGAEDFEAAWRSNESYARAWTAVGSSVAPFDGGAGVEGFAGTWTHATTE